MLFHPLKFKPFLLQTQAGMPYTNTHKHRISYFKSILTFLSPAKQWKSISIPEMLPISSSSIIIIIIIIMMMFNFKIFSLNQDEISPRSMYKYS